MAQDQSSLVGSWTSPVARTGHGVTQRSGAIRTTRVDGRQDRHAFVDLPRLIYRNDPAWVAPLMMQAKEFIDPTRHPFYKHGQATQFLARRDGRAVGRILVSDDPHYNEQHGTNTGCFGMFESVDDQDVADELFSAAADWLRARGRTAIMGPIDYSTNYPCGLLIDGFDTPPRLMMNHHPQYYGTLMSRWGLEKAKDLYAWWFTRENQIDPVWRNRVEALNRRRGVKIRSIRRDDFRNEICRCKKIYNDSFDENWGFVRMTDAEFDHLATQLKHFAVPDLIRLAEVDGQPVGLSITLPDMNEAVKPIRGRLSTWGVPIGLARLAYRMRHIKTVRMAVLSVVRGQRCRGIAEQMILDTFDHGMRRLDYTAAELSWTLEDNTRVNRTIERVGGQRYKTYRIFEKSLV
jgi:hypothetical protein